MSPKLDGIASDARIAPPEARQRGVVGFPREKPCLIPMSRRPAGGILARTRRIFGDYHCVPSITERPTRLLVSALWGVARAMLVTQQMVR